MSNSKITVSADVMADINKVWDYWTAPRHIVNWNFASDDWHCPKAENDLKTGGKFSCTMASKDGKMSFDFGGVYDDVKEKNRIAYTLGDGRKVEVKFENKEGKTQVVETFEPESENSPEMQKTGWQAIMDNFKKYVEGK